MRVLIVRGDSMLPFLRPGDRVAVRPVRDPLALPPGALVLVCPAGRPAAVHRLVRVAADRLVTWGDNRPALDTSAASASVRGVVVAWRRRGAPWRRPRPAIARLLAWLAPPVPRLLAAFGQMVLAPIAAGPVRGPLPGSRRVRPPAPPPAPVAGEGFQVQRLGTEWAVYDPGSRDVHLLNPLAYAIWHRAMAGLDKQALLRELRGTYPDMPTRQLESDLDATLLELGQKGLLISAHAP